MDIQYEGKKAGSVHFKTRFEAASVPEAAPEDEPVAEKSKGDKSKKDDEAEETKAAPEKKEDAGDKAAKTDEASKPSGPVETANGGELKIHVIEAKLTRDTEYWGKMDPYVEIKTSVGTKRTATHQEGGRTPVWNEEITFDVAKVDDEVEFLVQEEDNASADLVGDTVIKMSKLIASEPIQQWIEIKYEKKSAGKVHIKTTWTPFPPDSARLK